MVFPSASALWKRFHNKQLFLVISSHPLVLSEWLHLVLGCRALLMIVCQIFYGSYVYSRWLQNRWCLASEKSVKLENQFQFLYFLSEYSRSWVGELSQYCLPNTSNWYIVGSNIFPNISNTCSAKHILTMDCGSTALHNRWFLEVKQISERSINMHLLVVLWTSALFLCCSSSIDGCLFQSCLLLRLQVSGIIMILVCAKEALYNLHQFCSPDLHISA